MRKIMLMALCFLVLGSTAFALDMVIGGGGLYGWTLEQYDHYDENHSLTDHQDNNASVYGGFVFFGLSRYMEASISVVLENNAREWRSEPGEIYEDSGSKVGISLYLKYPLTLGSNFVFFPTAGADLQNNYGGLDLWFRGGLGVDIFFGQSVFLRAQAIYGVGFMQIYKGALAEGTTALPAHGPLFKLGFGWMY